MRLMPWMVLVMTACGGGPSEPHPVQVDFDPGAHTWAGTWANTNNSSNGQIACTVTEDGGSYDIAFFGEFQGDEWTYQVEATPKPDTAPVTLTGESNVGAGDDPLTFTVVVTDDTLTGDYASRDNPHGNRGSFLMRKRSPSK